MLKLWSPLPLEAAIDAVFEGRDVPVRLSSGAVLSLSGILEEMCRPLGEYLRAEVVYTFQLQAWETEGGTC